MSSSPATATTPVADGGFVTCTKEMTPNKWVIWQDLEGDLRAYLQNAILLMVPPHAKLRLHARSKEKPPKRAPEGTGRETHGATGGANPGSPG